MGEEIHKSLPDRGPQGSAVQRGGGDGRPRPLWRSVRETIAAAIEFSGNTDPKRSGEEQGGVASQEKDLSIVAAVRPQETASTERSLFARRQ